MIRVWGLANCDRCRAARQWLDSRGISYEPRDIRAEGIARPTLAKWAAEIGWERLLNRQSTTWRGLAEAERADLDAARAVDLMAAHPTLIKRPLFDLGNARLVGFDDEVRAVLAGAAGTLL